jgi:hypothetical protein
MAAKNIPYFSVPGTIIRILEKIKAAGTPENFNGDFLENTLGFKGGNYKTFIPWAKKVGLINSDGTPTSIYKKFRNPTTSKASLGEAIRKGYADIFAKDENAHLLDKPKFKGLVMEATGESHDSKMLELIVNTYWNAKTLAEFETNNTSETDDQQEEVIPKGIDNKSETGHTKKVNLGLNYTINLVLPKTDDPAIYNAIFKSLRENLLKD